MRAETTPEPAAHNTYRTLFLSDIHFATRSCRAAALLGFLQVHHADRIYLVGDIVDFWRLRRKPRWLPAQTLAVKELLRRAERGVPVVYIPGNHDNEIRSFAGTSIGSITVRLRAVHETAAGVRFLVIHGDEFDVVMRKARWLAVLGDIGYDLALRLNVIVNALRESFGLPYWSLAAYLKHRVKRAVNYIGNFELLLAEEARREGASGVICGHIHHAAMRDVEGIAYVNTGDWVESCTAVVEHFDGRLELVRWAEATPLSGRVVRDPVTLQQPASNEARKAALSH